MSLRRALLPFVLAPVVLLVGCKPDGRDLEQTVNYYYGIEGRGIRPGLPSFGVVDCA